MRELLGGLGIFTALLLLIYLLNASASILSNLSEVKSLINEVINYGNEGFKIIRNNGNLSELNRLRSNLSRKLSEINSTFTQELRDVIATLSKYMRDVEGANESINKLINVVANATSKNGK